MYNGSDDLESAKLWARSETLVKLEEQIKLVRGSPELQTTQVSAQVSDPIQEESEQASVAKLEDKTLADDEEPEDKEKEDQSKVNEGLDNLDECKD